MNSRKRIVLALCAVRSGKTSTGSPWMYREVKRRGAGDYLIATPTYQILQKAAQVELDKVFRQKLNLGALRGDPYRFEISPAGEMALWGARQDRATRILFGHADNPDSLAAMEAKAAWCDEVGQNIFRLGSWEEIQSRLAIDRGRVLLTSAIYNFGWTKTELYDKWEAANRNHEYIDVIQFDSLMNPAFDPEEYERLRASLQPAKFDLRYRAIYTKPAGMIYGNFDRVKHTCPRFAIPDDWARSLGMDFGGVNTAGVFFAKEPNGPYYAYREYWPRVKRTAKDHKEAIMRGEPRLPRVVGGSGSEDQWRDEFAAAGMPIKAPPVTDVEVGIDRLYAIIQRNGLIVFDDLVYLLDELATYSRVLDESGEPTEAIADKASFHCADACRYWACDAEHVGKKLWFGFSGGDKEQPKSVS